MRLERGDALLAVDEHDGVTIKNKVAIEERSLRRQRALGDGYGSRPVTLQNDVSTVHPNNTGWLAGSVMQGVAAIAVGAAGHDIANRESSIEWRGRRQS